jgi:hypothetical protein
MKPVVVALAGLLAATPPADAASVALFNNETYVPVAGANAEAHNVQSSLLALDEHFVVPFTATTAHEISSRLLDMDAVVIPEQENSGNLTADLGPGGRAAYREFVRDGGTLVINGEQNARAETFLNGVFDLGVDEQSTPGPDALQPAAASQTEFEGGPASLPDNEATEGLLASGLPSGAKAMYADATHAAVAVFHYGAGSIVYLGWDWFNSAPPNAGGAGGGWQDVLHRSVVTPVIAQPSRGAMVAEGDAGTRPMTFDFTLSFPTSEELTVGYETSLLSATPGEDVIPRAGRMTFTRGSTSQSVDLYVIGDTVFEPDEFFELRIGDARNVKVPKPIVSTSIGVILNDDLAPGRCANRRDGTDASETLNGTVAGDLIFGLAGNDFIRGGGERDCLRGGLGNDRLDGGDADDRLSGEAGDDRLSGRDGSDRLSGGDGADRLNGGGGHNSYSGGAGNDRISARNDVGREKVKCGAGSGDRATVDRTDRVSGCESISRH